MEEEKEPTITFPMTATPEQIKSIEHVAFEAYHLRLISRLCKNGLKERWRCEAEGSSYPRSFYDSTFEYTFYIHLRVLFYFFYVPPRKDDVTLSDFVKPALIALQPVGTDDDIQDFKNHLSKRLAHLTGKRRTPQPVDSAIGDALLYYLEYGDKLMLNLIEFENSLSEQLKHAYQSRIDAFTHRDRELRRILQAPVHFGIAHDLDVSQPGEPLALPPNHPHANRTSR